MRKTLLFLGFICLSMIAHSNTIIVTNTNDGGIGSFRYALDNAQVGDTVRFDPGLIANGSDTIFLSSQLIITKPIHVVGLMQGGDTLYVSGSNLFRVIDINVSSGIVGQRNVYLDSMALCESNITGPGNRGGCIRVAQVDSVFIDNCHLANAQAQYGGGGIYVHSSAIILRNTVIRNTGNIALYALYSYVEVIDSRIHHSTTTLPGSSAIFSGNSHTILHNSEFNYNVSPRSPGFLQHEGTYSITDCAFRYNHATINGGALSFYLEDTVSIHLSGCTFEGNHADDYGGAIHISADSVYTFLENCVFLNNTCGEQGGGLYAKAYAESASYWEARASVIINMEDCTFEGNIAADIGGGISVEVSSSPIALSNSNTDGRMTMKRCVFKDNSAENSGGGLSFNTQGIWVLQGYSTINNQIDIMDSCVFSGNTTGEYAAGGAIFQVSGEGLVDSLSQVATRLNIRDSYLEDNYGGAGGAITVRAPTSELNIRHCKILNNEARYRGGAIYTIADGAEFTSGHSRILISDTSEISGNNCEQFGGAIFTMAIDSSSIYVRNHCTLDGNSAGKFGGAISNVSDMSYSVPRTEIHYSTLSNNTAEEEGGGIYQFTGSDANYKSYIKLVNATFTGNHSEVAGGAIAHICHNINVVDILNSTIHLNSAPTSAGLYLVQHKQVSSAHRTFIKGSILAGNGGAGNNLYLSSPLYLLSGGHNILGWSPTGAITTDQTSITMTQLALQALDYYGGGARTLKPYGHSVAMQTGDPTDYSLAQNGQIVGVREVGAAESELCIVNYDTLFTQDSLMVLDSLDSYQWIRCDSGNSPLPGDTLPTFYPPGPGNYAVVVSNYTCIDTSACYTIIPLVGMKPTTSEGNIQIYPNPSNDAVFLITPMAIEGNVEAIDALGRSYQLMTTRTSNNQYYLRLPKASGMYLLQFQTKEGQQMRRVIKL